MQSHNHSAEDKFNMNFGAFDPDLFTTSHMGATMGVGSNTMGLGLKRSAHDAGLDREHMGLVSSDDDCDMMKKDDKMGGNHSGSGMDNSKPNLLPNGKKTKGRVKIKMEFIDNKLRRYTTFSKRKTGIMKKAYELSTLTGTQVMLLVASETGHVYTFATRKLQPMITSEAGKALIQTCLNSPDPPQVNHHHHDQRMSATGYEETELTYAVNDEDHKLDDLADEYLGRGSTTPSDSSNPPSPSTSPTHSSSIGPDTHAHTQFLSGLVLSPNFEGGSVMVGAPSTTNPSPLMYNPSNGVVYSPSASDSQILHNLPPGLLNHDQNVMNRLPGTILDKTGVPIYVGTSNQQLTLPLPITLASAALQQAVALQQNNSADAAQNKELLGLSNTASSSKLLQQAVALQQSNAVLQQNSAAETVHNNLNASGLMGLTSAASSTKLLQQAIALQNANFENLQQTDCKLSLSEPKISINKISVADHKTLLNLPKSVANDPALGPLSLLGFGSRTNDAFPTDLSMHIKRESK